MKKIIRDFSHYLSLIAIFLAGFFAFVTFRFDRPFQLGVILATAIGYVVWGIIHHLIHKDLYLSVVIEYIVIALLGIVLVLSVILRS